MVLIMGFNFYEWSDQEAGINDHCRSLPSRATVFYCAVLHCIIFYCIVFCSIIFYSVCLLL